MTDDPHAITSVEQLRSVIGERIDSVALKIRDHLDEMSQDFVASSGFLLLATADADGAMDVSPKGDAAGFVLIEDETTLVIPDRPGNKLACGHSNIIENPNVALLFCRPATDETLRVNGTATLTADPELLERLAARGKPALLAVRVTVTEAFFHCGKAFIRSNLWRPDAWPEKQKVSFGKLYASMLKGDATMAKAIDAQIDSDYRDNL